MMMMFWTGLPLALVGEIGLLRTTDGLEHAGGDPRAFWTVPLPRLA